MVDIQNLAKEIADSLIPALPYIAMGGKEAIKEIGKNIGGAVTEKAKKIWNLLHHKIENNQTALESVKKLAKNPNDSNSLHNFEKELIEILKNNIELINKLTKLNIIYADSHQQIDVHGNVNKQVIIQKINKIDKLKF